MIFIYIIMDRFTNYKDFDKEVVLDKLAELSSKLEKERNKSDEERSLDIERKLMYEQMIQGLKLNTMYSRRFF